MSESARTWGLRLLALLIALSIWYRVSLEDRETLTERTVEAGITYDRPVGYIILDQVNSVYVRVRGTSRRIRELTPYQVNVQVNLDQTQQGTMDINLEPRNVQVPQGFEVVSIEPNKIRVELDKEISQSLPVEASLVGKVPTGYRSLEPEVFPNTVLVTGPESLIGRLRALNTRPVSLTGRTETFEDSVTVLSPEPLVQVAQPSKVAVRVPIQRIDPENDQQEEPPKGP
ncbi:MAG TPA: CdaR family protein [Thermoanaerobaculia bacterium]|nr:CdaR family protein [Thermoanaerobaculia bacterium]